LARGPERDEDNSYLIPARLAARLAARLEYNQLKDIHGYSVTNRVAPA